MRPCGGRFAGLGVVGQDPVDRGELGEWRVQLAARDFLAVDFEVLEERLVEEPALGRVGLEVGGLDVVGELEGEVEGAGDGLLIDLVAIQELLGGGALAADAGLFLREDVLADLVCVVGRQELALLVVEPGHLSLGACGLFCGDVGDAVDVRCDGIADAVALQLIELDRRVVTLDGCFDSLDAVVRLLADAGGATAADEVVVQTAVAALGLGEEEAAPTLGAAQGAAQVVVVDPAALT